MWASARPKPPKARPTPVGVLSPNVFVSIDKTGTVTIVAHRSEMGQGVRTSVPMILADELEADWSRVKIEQAAGDKIYGNQYTDGSRSVRHNFERMREFGAITRTMLEQAAAIKWGVSSLGVQGAEPQGGARAHRPHLRLRRAGGNRRRAEGAQRQAGHAQGREGLPLHRQAHGQRGLSAT